MRILGIDTTTKFLCLGIYDNARVYEYNLELGRKLSALLHPTIERTLGAAGLSIRMVDYFTCGLGPGSFTGARLGLATILGLSWSLKKPVIGISTLDILAKGVKQNANQLVPVIDARRNLIYCSCFKNVNESLRRTRPYMLLSEDELYGSMEPGAVVFGDAV
ncbi:MAG: tRNA (adenosine(37)-N6)-threonylcarbamoyltransferase complex dimerization subunit type 1 TsaB, partial [Omnitrophica WOR_2 bacterium RBG_13_44_8b]